MFVRRKKLNFDSHRKNALDLINYIVKKNNLDSHFNYNRISVRNQKTRWGSCSSKGNLNFNFRIVFLPDELAEYLVIHEFCHLKEMNHSHRYWKLVSSFDIDYKKHQIEMKKYIVFKSRIKPIKLGK